MKILRFILLIGIVSTVVLMTNDRSTAQSTNATKNKTPLDKYAQLILSLSEHGQSNTVAQICDFLSAAEKERSATDIGVNVILLNDLRSGKTNEAIRLLETRLDGALMLFGASSEENTNYNKILRRAKEYRSKYPHESGGREVDAAIAHAFDSLAK
jgi:hypothetical protein